MKSMSDDEKRRIIFPSIQEIVYAFEVATDARDLVNEFAKTGHCTGSTLISLGKSLYDLEMELFPTGGSDLEAAIALRSDEVQNDIARHPEVSAYFEYYIVYDSEDRETRKGTIYKLERDETGSAIWRDKQP